MVIQLNTPAIIGIAIGGGVLLVLSIFAVIRVSLRRKHQALLADIDRNHGQRRAHLTITDEDVLRMPGTRRIRPSPYDNGSGWAPMSSRESFAKKGLSPNPADVDPVTGLPPWPVRIPRRLKKAQSSPAVRIPLAALSPITERSTNNTATSPTLSKVTDPDTDNGKTQPSQRTFKGIYRLDSCPNLDVSPNLLKPNPLFHGQQRSFSHGVLTSIDNIGKARGPDPASSWDNTDFAQTQLARMRRSSSLCSQQPGLAPTIPIPPLPIELDATRRSRPIKSPPEASPRRMSGVSLLSGDTSVLDEMASKGFSQADTDFTSNSLSSPPHSASINIGLGISNENHPKWNFSRVDRSVSPLSAAAKARNIRLQVNQQHSFRASIQNSLPRSASSGLSMSLLEYNSPNPKASLNAAKANLELPGRSERSTSRRNQLPQASPLSNMNVFRINEDMKSKRASTSILQVVSGNQASPVKNPWNDRPTSIATDDPFRWDPKTSMQSGKRSAMKKAGRGHKRQSCVRISNIPIIIPSRNPSFLREDLQPSFTPLISPAPNIRAPSLAAFNPQLQLPRGIRSCRAPTSTNTTSEVHPSPPPYSPTFSMIPLYSSPSRSSSSSSLASTPTRVPPFSKPQAARNPNRRRRIFPSSNGPAWPPLLSSSITPQDPPTDLQPPSPSPRLSTSASAVARPHSEEWDSRPSSFLLSFPSPPMPPSRHPAHALPSRRCSSPTTKRTSPVRGPRPLPSTSPRRRARFRVYKAAASASPSPRNSMNTRSGSPAKMDMLRRSIIELRRMNSEVVREEGGKGHGHGRYLSLGGREGGVEEEGRDGEGDWDRDRIERGVLSS